MLRSSSWRSRACVALVLLAAATVACRTVPPPSGTPLRSGESLAVGVVREHDGWGLRQAELIASCEQIASDIARLTGIGDGSRPVVLLLADPTNATALPAMSFAPVRFQLVSGLTHACEARGFRVVRASDPDAESADFSVLSEVRGAAREGGAFIVDYLVAEGSRKAEPAGALIGPVRATVQ